MCESGTELTDSMEEDNEPPITSTQLSWRYSPPTDLVKAIKARNHLSYQGATFYVHSLADDIMQYLHGEAEDFQHAVIRREIELIVKSDNDTLINEYESIDLFIDLNEFYVEFYGNDVEEEDEEVYECYLEHDPSPPMETDQSPIHEGRPPKVESASSAEGEPNADEGINDADSQVILDHGVSKLQIRNGQLPNGNVFHTQSAISAWTAEQHCNSRGNGMNREGKG